MGEAKRKRARGIDTGQIQDAIIEALNSAAGARLWFDMRADADESEPPMRYVYRIAASEAEVDIAAVEEVDLNAPDRRDVFVALLRSDKPWIGARVLDLDPHYNREAYVQLGSWASDIATPQVPDVKRVPSTSMILYSAWAERDFEIINGMDSEVPRSNGT